MRAVPPSTPQRSETRKRLDWLLPAALLGLVVWLSVELVGAQIPARFHFADVTDRDRWVEYNLARHNNDRAAATRAWENLPRFSFLGFPFIVDQRLDNDRSAQFVEFGIALAAFALLAWGWWLKSKERDEQHRVLRDRLLVALGLSAFLGYFNFGHLHFGNFVHVWDTYHYYMGAKYFPELGYDKLYDCAAVVDAESGRLAEVQRRTMTDLRTNVMVRTDEIIADPQRCKAGFSPERWEAYKRDINVFRGMVGEQRWTDIHHDHGFNGTPVWTLAGLLFTNLGAKLEPLIEPSDPGYKAAAEAARLGAYRPMWDYNDARTRRGEKPVMQVGARHVVWLNLLDPLYILLTALIIWWAFGPRAFAVALIVLGTNFPNRYYWTGGAFLRHDWLFFLVASVALLKKDRPALAGAALAYTTLLRLFPGLIVFGPALAAVEYFRVNRKVDPAFKRYVVGGLVATAVLLGGSFVLFGGPSVWERFAQNTVKHANTPLTNHMGLRTVLSYRPSTVGQQMTDSALIDPWSPWKETRLEKFQQAKPLFYALFLGACALIYFALRHSGPTQYLGASLGIGLIVFGAELTNYYYCFLMGIAVLHERRREVGLIVAALAAFTLFVEFGPLNGMSHELDQQYTVMSAGSLVAIVAIWWSFTKWGAPRCFEPEPPSTAFPRPLLAFAGLAAPAPGPASQEDQGNGKGRKRKKKR